VITETKKIPILKDGKVINVITIMRDVTKLKQVESALQENVQRYRNVCDTAPLAFVLWDRDTLVTEWNNRAEQLFGWTREEIIGKTFFLS